MKGEHGFYWVDPTNLKRQDGAGLAASSAERWQCMMGSHQEDEEWKTIVLELMKQYSKRVQGSVIEYKGSAITWNYRHVGALMVAKEIALELTRFLDPESGPDALMQDYSVTVVNGPGYVEVRRKDVDKGVAVNRTLETMKKKFGEIDFVLCIGDDRSDEDMFAVVNKMAEDRADDLSSAPASPKMAPKSRKSLSMTFEDHDVVQNDRSKFYTVTVGRKISKAGFFLKDTAEVSDLLQKLASQAVVTKLSKFSSMPALAQQVPPDSDDEDM